MIDSLIIFIFSIILLVYLSPLISLVIWGALEAFAKPVSYRIVFWSTALALAILEVIGKLLSCMPENWGMGSVI